MEINKPVRIWIFIGVVMLFIQILLGGITRLTGSGLSITKWEIVTGTLPPLNKHDWEHEFNLYKATPQYKKINEGIDLNQFKSIYFWEYIHRLWARLMGFIFIIPCLYFSWKKWLNRQLWKDLVVVICLAGLAASFGWIMVVSGLIDRPWVNAYKLTAHLGIGVAVFSYMFWIFLKYSISNVTKIEIVPIGKRLVKLLSILIGVQLLFGGLMSGMKACLFYPTWPDMQGEFFPHIIFNKNNWTVYNFMSYDTAAFVPALIQLFHRSLAYIILLISIFYVIKFWNNNLSKQLVNGLYSYSGLLITQLIIGVLTLINCNGRIPTGLGVIHQALGILLFASSLYMNFILNQRSIKIR